jgi:CRP-like cAMP-binding protein
MDTTQLDTATATEITRAARDYFEGWYDADSDRMARALHQELAKRTQEADGSVRTTTRDRMIELTAAGAGREDGTDRTLEVSVVDVHDGIATAVVRSAVYREYLHLVRTDDGWRIVNALWALTAPGRAES